MRTYKPYNPKPMEYAELSLAQKEQLRLITPSKDDGVTYFPCSVNLKDSSHLECVYIVNAQEFILYWGAWPEDDPGKKSIKIEEVDTIQESRSTIPAKFADKIYDAGESGMGYTIFTALFSDGTKKAYAAGNAVDFIEYPAGKTQDDIIDVFPHEGREEIDTDRVVDFYWCLYGKGIPR